MREKVFVLQCGVSKVLATSPPWPQSGEMFIERCRKEYLAPEERNALIAKPGISLLRSFKLV
jgi:hypothetical protein